MKKFTQEFLDEIQMDISPSALASMLKLKVASSNGDGSQIKVFSPFKEEKTASCNISVKDGFTVWKDFSSDKGGRAINLVKGLNGGNFVQAVEQIAQELSVSPRYEENGKATTAPKQKKKPLLDILSWVSKAYAGNVQKTVSYCRGRGFSSETVKKWGLGYARESWDAVTSNAEDLDSALEVGLVCKSEKTGKIYDFFRDRLIFPITHQGSVVAIAGRKLYDASEGAKYLNTKASAVYDKSKVLYGFDNACRLGGSKVHIVEGYFDVIALDTVHIPAAGTCGTSLTDDHIKLAFSQFDEIVFCFDGDEAGQEAKKRALGMVLPYLGQGKSASFITLSGDKDPADLVQDGDLLVFDKTESLSEALTAGLTDLSEAEKMKAIEILKERFSMLQDSLQKMFLICQIAEHLGLPKDIVKQFL